MGLTEEEIQEQIDTASDKIKRFNKQIENEKNFAKIFGVKDDYVPDARLDIRVSIEAFRRMYKAKQLDGVTDIEISIENFNELR